MAMSSGGLHKSSFGSMYCLSSLLHRSAHQSHNSEMYTEEQIIGKFDDIVLEVNESGKNRYVFSQAKHKKNPINFNLKTFIGDKFQLSKFLNGFQVLKNNFLTKHTLQRGFDDELNSFMDRLVFVTSLESKDIWDMIQKDLRMKLGMSDVSIPLLKLKECVKNAKISNKPIVAEDYYKVIEEYELFTNKLIVMEKTREIFSGISNLELQATNKEIAGFLNHNLNPANNILHVKSDTELVSMQIYRSLSTTALYKDNYIMMKTSFSEGDFERGLKVFEKLESFKFMIIEVDAEDKLFEKFRDQIMQILKNPSKRLIVITDVKSRIIFSKCTSLDLGPVYLKDLNATSVVEVLSREYEFQNFFTNVRLQDFLNGNARRFLRSPIHWSNTSVMPMCEIPSKMLQNASFELASTRSSNNIPNNRFRSFTPNPIMKENGESSSNSRSVFNKVFEIYTFSFRSNLISKKS